MWIHCVTTVTVPTPIRPILTCLRPSRVIRITSEHPMPNPNPLAPSQANLRLMHLRTLWPPRVSVTHSWTTLTPLRLVDAFPTRCTSDLSSPSHQVNSWHPHSFLTWCLSTFTLLRQVYSRCLIGLTTAVGQSPIAYLPRSMRHSLSFLALYIYVPLLSIVHSSVTSLTTLRSFSMSHPQFPVSVYPCFIYLYSLPPSTLFSYSIHSLRPIPDRSDQPNPYHTRTCINTLVTSCCSSVW